MERTDDTDFLRRYVFETVSGNDGICYVMMTCREKIMSNDYADIFTNYISLEEISGTTPVDYCFHRIDGDFGIVNVRRSDIPTVSIGHYGYTSIPNLYGIMQAQGELFNPENLVSTGSIMLQGPPLSLTGRGVILGFIDTGIRYQLDVFRREDGSSRIVSIWDQTIQEGEPPEGFRYGTEYKKADIDRALESDEPETIVPTTDTIGHGTELASVAAGSILNQGLTFRGAAPQADIAVVKLKGAKQYLRDYYLVAEDAVAYQENDIMEAVKYLERMAVAFSRPVVIVLGVGTNLGSHCGTSPLAAYLNAVAMRRSRAIVVCGGNEGDKAHHYSGVMPDSVEIRVEEQMRGFCAELWGELPGFYAITIRSPGGEISTEIDFRNGIDREISFIFEKTRIYAGIIPVEYGSGEEVIFMRFQDPTPGVWTVNVYSSNVGQQGGGTFNMWLPIESFLEKSVTFLTPDLNVTLTEPSNAGQVITISAFDALNDSWYAPSGRGFTRSGAIKPDLSAPGVRVSTALGERSGSSLATALAAGCVAQFFEWAIVDENAVFVQGRAIKSYLIRGAVRSGDITYPDRRWGYGKISISGTFETLARV